MPTSRLWRPDRRRIALAGLLVASCLAQPLAIAGEKTGLQSLPTQEIDRIVDAIYQAEGGANTRYPFGIRSVPCSGDADCRAVCRRTVVNTYARWQRAGQPGPFLPYLAARYAPANASNDPRGLNRHWLRNVQSRLSK